MQQAHTYQERSREYLGKAFRELADGDLTQASEKGWGAAAQIVKAVANERGQRHSQHRDVLGMAQALARETGNRDMEIEFALARELHSNFYEDTFEHEEVEWRLQRVEQFVNRVERLLHQGR